MTRLYYCYYRWRYEIPHPDEIYLILLNRLEEPNQSWLDVVIEYSVNQPINDIASMNNMTRERVRQIVWKFWRLHNNKK